MNFMSKISRKPSKQNVKPTKRRENSKNINQEEQYIEVDLEIEEEARPPVPLFIGGPSGNNNDPSGGADGDFDDEFFDGAVEDDLELGEEALVFYDKQKNNSFYQSHGNSFSQPNGTYPGPATGDTPQYGAYPPPPQLQMPPDFDMAHQYTGNTNYPPAPIIIGGGGYSRGTDSPANRMQVPGSIPGGGLYYPGVAAGSTASTPMSMYQPQMMHLPSPHPMPAYNYLGLTEIEMFEFHRLIANGVPEMDAIRTIQYNRILHPQRSSPLSRTTSGIPPAPITTVDEEDHVYQMILKESIEEEQKRLQRLRASNANDGDLTGDEAMSIALQQSYDDYERSVRSGRTPAYGSPSSNNGMHYSPSASLLKSSMKPPPSSKKVMNTIEKANEDALRQAIQLSMQEASINSGNNSFSQRKQSNSQSYPLPYQSSQINTPATSELFDARAFSTATKSGSFENYNGYADQGLEPEQPAASPYHQQAPDNGSFQTSSSSNSRHQQQQQQQQPPLNRQSQHGDPYNHTRVPAPISTTSSTSGYYSPSGGGGSGYGSGRESNNHNNSNHSSHPPVPRDINAAHMILARRNQPQSFHAGTDLQRSRSNDSQDNPRLRRPYQSMPGLDLATSDEGELY